MIQTPITSNHKIHPYIINAVRSHHYIWDCNSSGLDSADHGSLCNGHLLDFHCGYSHLSVDRYDARIVCHDYNLCMAHASVDCIDPDGRTGFHAYSLAVGREAHEILEADIFQTGGGVALSKSRLILAVVGPRSGVDHLDVAEEQSLG